MKSVFLPLLEKSMNDRTGLAFYVNGQMIPGVVRKIEDKIVIAYNQQFDHIHIRIDQLDAVASN